MATMERLQQMLYRIDGKGYRAYKDIQGQYDFPSFLLAIDHVQGDPFAAPSKIRVRVPMHRAQLPAPLYSTATRRLALEDFLTRQLHRAIGQVVDGGRGSGKSGLIRIDAGRQEVLERTAVVLQGDWVEARLEAGLPARGRAVMARQAEAMLCRELPRIVEKGLYWQNTPQQEALEFIACVENYTAIRKQLAEQELVAFVADGSILPRESGATDRPMRARDAVAFKAPESLRCTMKVPNPVEGQSEITGLGIPTGVTVIVGGGYHGKSTLLQALERGVYPHVPGDGRERVMTHWDAVKVRAEDGRRVENVNISPFISNLPYGRSTQNFGTDDASGSTSQAANIIEALEAGAQLLLLDEDTSATNFMVRDARMQNLVHKEHEPITPFLDRVRALYDELGVSTVLVMGGCGDYFDVADTVIMMQDYLPLDVTAEAKRIAQEHATKRVSEALMPLTDIAHRIPKRSSFDASRGRREVKIDARELDLIRFGEESINLRGVEQLIDFSQTRAVGNAIYLAQKKFMDGVRSLREIIDALEAFFDEQGLDALDPFHRPGQHPGNFARPRKYEIAAAINRLRTVRMQHVQ